MVRTAEASAPPPQEYASWSASDQSPDDGFRVQARGHGAFTLRVNNLLPPEGNRLSGAVDPHLSDASSLVFRTVAMPGALLRGNVNMQSEVDQSEYACRLVQNAHALGYRIMLTFIGTAQSYSSRPEEPDYHRYPPTDPALWAEDLIALLGSMWTGCGDVPDYVKIWNEPDRPEYWLGDRNEFLDLFVTASHALGDAIDSGRLPAGLMKIGGPGMAGAASAMGGSEPVLYSILEQAAAQQFPLDFLCWHHYIIGNGLRFYGTVQDLRSRAAALGLAQVELHVDEWNIYPSAQNLENPLELDSARAAANAAIFVAAAGQTDPDGVFFFQLQDVDAQSQILDLTGAGNGLMTRRGVKKPVFRMMELVRPMLSESRVRVTYPRNEWSAGVFATRLGNRVQVVVANDPVDHQWIWTEACLERGGEPGLLDAAVDLLDSLHLPISFSNLVNVAGLTPEQALIVLDVRPISEEALALAGMPRTVFLQVEDVPHEAIALSWPAYRFDSGHNNPAARRDELLPTLEWIEDTARFAGYSVVAPRLTALGVTVPPYDPEVVLANEESFALYFGVTMDIARDLYPLYRNTVEEQRLAHVDLVSNLPASMLTPDWPAGLGIHYANGVISLTLEAGGAAVFQFTF